MGEGEGDGERNGERNGEVKGEVKGEAKGEAKGEVESRGARGKREGLVWGWSGASPQQSLGTG